MTFFRSHITRITGALALLIGMALHFASPESDKVRHEAFASWLQSHVKSQDNTGVINQINDLAAENVELDQVIRKASELVRSHSDDFELPVQTSAEDDVFHLLLSEWNNFRTSSGGMGNAVMIEQGKAPTVLPKDVLASAGKLSPKQISFHYSTEESADLLAAELFTYTLSPLSGGISINAP